MIDAQLQPFLKEWEKQWSTLKANATPADRRDHFEIVARNMRLPTPEGIIERVHSVNGVHVLEHSHENAGLSPALIYMHGGAYMQGSPETHYDITTRLAAWSGFRVFSVHYALAPEKPFPAGLNDVETVAHWVFDNASTLKVDAKKIAIGGDSAGANLATVTALSLVGKRQFLGQLLVYPGIDATFNRASHQQNPNGPIISVAGMPMVMNSYCPDKEMQKHWRVSPFYAEDLSKMPKSYVAVAEHDPLRDEGIAYARKMKKHGVSVKLTKGKGLIHGYLRGMDYCNASMKSLKNMAAWLKSL